MTSFSSAAFARLALDGGPAVRQATWPAWPQLSEAQIEAAMRVLRSGRINYWTGDEGRQFEHEYAAAVGRRFAIAVANGTLALELALLALNIGPGDEVVVPSRTFIASASCVVARGAIPVCADVDRDSQNLTAESVARCLSPRVKAIVAVHLAGLACDLDPILDLARQQKLKLIEDCAQAHGALYRGRPVGSFGDAAAFSFCQDKIITTGGEGGILLLDDEEGWQRAWSYKDHGKSFDLAAAPNPSGGFRWLHESFGSNWRLTEMQAAMGRVGLRELSAQVEARRRNAAVLVGCLQRQPALRVYVPPADFRHAYYKLYAFIVPERLKPEWDRDRIRASISAEGIPCQTGSCSEIYREAAFGPWRRPAGSCAIAHELGETSLMFFVHPTLDSAALADTCAAIEKVLGVATR